MSGILRLESLTKGNTLKQGDKTPLKYRLFDADGEKLNVAGKSAKVRLVYPDFLTIGYEKDGLIVAQDDTVTFMIDKVIPAKLYHVEIIVDDKFVFPSRADESKFTVDKSSLGTESSIIEIVGVDAVVKKAVNLINKDPNLIIDEDKLVGDIISNTGIGNIEEYYQQFNDVITELSEEKDYHSLPEISAARGGHETLGARLDETTAQLAQKTSKGNVSVGDINKNLGKLDQSYMSDEFLQQIAGNTPVNAVPANHSITSVKLADKSVNAEKLSDEIVSVDKSTNLIDPTKLTDGGYFDSSTGAWVASGQFAITDFILVEPNKTYSKSIAGNVTFWDESRNFISGLVNALQTFTVPSTQNIAYIRVNLYKYAGLQIEKVMLVEGDTLPSSYVPYFRSIRVNDAVKIKLEENVTALEKKLERVETIPPSINLFNKEMVVSGGYYDSKTGAWTSNQSFAVSELLPVKPGEVYAKETGSGQITFWDADGKFVTGIDVGKAVSFAVPSNSKITHMRVNIYLFSTEIHAVMVVKGNVLPESYVPYYEEKYLFPKDKYAFEQDVEPIIISNNYMTPEIEEYNRITNPVLTKTIVTDRTGVDGVADPFIVFDKGCYHMFFEVLGGTNPNTLESSDEIGHAYSYDLKNWTYTQIVISKEEHGHRSAYPNVFKYEGEWYMVPDTVGNIKLYKAKNFPLEWEFQLDLITGKFVDTNIFKIGDVWFMTTSSIPANNITLYYNTSGDWRNQGWTRHPLGNIIAADATERGKRNAGNIFHGGDHIIMPVQITPVESGVYGEYTYWYKLSDITSTTCTVTNLGKALDPSHTGDWKNAATHHLSHVEHSNGTIYAVDGLSDGGYSIGLYANE